MTRLAPRNPGRSGCAVLLAWLIVAIARPAVAQDRYGVDEPSLPVAANSSPQTTPGPRFAGQPSSPAPPVQRGAAEAAEPVVEVRIENSRTISASQVLGQRKTLAGRPFDEETFR